MRRLNRAWAAGTVFLSLLVVTLVAMPVSMDAHRPVTSAAVPLERSTDLASTSGRGNSPRTTPAVTADPILGDWSVTYGSYSVVTMSLSSGTYSVVGKTPIELTGGSSCYLPPGTLIATFSGSGGSYSGQHGLWYPNDCSFAYWTPITLTRDGDSLIVVFTASATSAPFTKIAVARKPDGRIQLGTGAFVGNDVYNSTGTNQSRTGSATPGHTVTFGISIQNDGTGTDKFKLKATGAATTAYTVKYFQGATDITAAVVAGTYQTPSLAPAATNLITATITVTAGATVGSNVTRLVTLTSVGDATKKDAVKFIGKRA